jgi:hypothetical protein
MPVSLPERAGQLRGVRDYLMAQAEAELVKTNFTEMIEAAYQRVGTLSQGGETPESKARSGGIDPTMPSASPAGEYWLPTPWTPHSRPQTSKSWPPVETHGQDRAFRRDEGHKEFVVGADFIKAAFSLRPRTVAVLSVVVMPPTRSLSRPGCRVKSPVRNRERVTTDFKQAQAGWPPACRRSLPLLTNGLAAGKTFSVALEA